MNSIRLFSIAILLAITATMGIVPILNTIQDAYGQGGDNRFGPNKDWPGDKNQGGGNDPPFKRGNR